MSGERGRQINGTVTLLIRKHYPGKVFHAGVDGPPYSWEAFYTAQDQSLGISVAEKIKQDFWVSLHRTTLVNTTHLSILLQIMKGYIAFACRTTTSATRGTWTR